MCWRPWLLSVLGTTLIVAGSGCGARKVVATSGVVTWEGKPLANANVVFLPTGSGPQATGYTDDEGKFELTTFNRKDGAIPGQYKVVINVYSGETGGDDPNNPIIASPEDAKDPGKMSKFQENQFKQMQKRRDEMNQPPENQKKGIHPNYTKLDKTPLIITVPSDGPIVLDLKKNGT